MRIAEVFHSIQGEGILLGVPSIFIRTSGCNLRCAWCDTPYASWSPEGDEQSVEELVALAEGFPSRHIVLTGGEPMIAKGTRELIACLRERGKHVTVETAGTVEPEGCIVDLASLSPKLSNSTPEAAKAGEAWVRRHEETRLQPGILRAWVETALDYQIKFVISGRKDLDEAEQVVASMGIPVPPEKVLLMPEGTSLDAMRSRYPLLIEACKTKGYRFSPRLHIELFGNQRGT